MVFDVLLQSILFGVFSVILSKKILSLSDEELIQRYQKGSEVAFQSLYARHKKPIYHFVLKSIKNSERSEEIVQEVFLRIIQSNGQQYNEKAKFTTWLYTVARNLCIDEHRKNKHKKELSLQQSVSNENSNESQLGDFLEGSPLGLDGEDRVFAKEIQTALSEGVELLPEEQRETFLMREVSQLKFKEIAEICETSENTIKSRMRYALEFLQRHLEAKGFQ